MRRNRREPPDGRSGRCYGQGLHARPIRQRLNGKLHLLSKLRSSSLISGTTVYLVSNIINAAIPFALLPTLTRYLAPTEYGQVAIFQTFIGALGAFVGLNVAGAASRKYYDLQVDAKGMQAFIASCLQILFFSTLITLLVVWIFQTQISEWLNLASKWLFTGILVSCMSVVINLRLTQWQVRKQPYKYGALQISQSIVNMGLSILFVVVFLNGSEGRILAQLWTTVVFSVLSVLLLRHDKILSFITWQPSDLREALKFGVPLIPHVAGGFLLVSADRLIINTELGLEKSGIYMVALQISLSLSLLFESINNAYVPWLFEQLKRNNYEEKKRIVRYTYTWYCLIITGITFVFLAGPWLIDLIADEKYSEAGTIIGWLALGQGFRGMYLMITNYIFYTKHTKILSATTISAGLINLLLLYTMIPKMGLKGAAIAYSISMLILLISTWILAQRFYPMPWLKFK